MTQQSDSGGTLHNSDDPSSSVSTVSSTGSPALDIWGDPTPGLASWIPQTTTYSSTTPLLTYAPVGATTGSIMPSSSSPYKLEPMRLVYPKKGEPGWYRNSPYVNWGEKTQAVWTDDNVFYPDPKEGESSRLDSEPFIDPAWGEVAP